MNEPVDKALLCPCLTSDCDNLITTPSAMVLEAWEGCDTDVSLLADNMQTRLLWTLISCDALHEPLSMAQNCCSDKVWGVWSKMSAEAASLWSRKEMRPCVRVDWSGSRCPCLVLLIFEGWRNEVYGKQKCASSDSHRMLNLGLCSSSKNSPAWSASFCTGYCQQHSPWGWGHSTLDLTDQSPVLVPGAVSKHQLPAKETLFFYNGVSLDTQTTLQRGLHAQQ